MRKKIAIILQLILFLYFAFATSPSAQAIIILPPLLILSFVSLAGGITAIMSIPTLIISALTTYILKPKSKKIFILHTLTLTLFLLIVFITVSWLFTFFFHEQLTGLLS